MRMKNTKKAITVLYLSLTMLLTACSGNDVSQNDTDTSKITTEDQGVYSTLQDEKIEETTEETAKDLYDLQTAIEAFEYDQILFADGTETSKNDAVWGYLDEETNTNVLGFDFAFMRYAQPIYRDTDIDPSLFDFDNFEFSYGPWEPIENIEYFKVISGETLGNGLVVSKAFCTVPWVNTNGNTPWLRENEACIGVNEIALDGSITMEGILFCYKEDPEYIFSEGDVIFYPNPVNSKYSPIPYIERGNKTNGIVDLNGKFAFVFDESSFELGNKNNMDLDISDYFENREFVKVKVTLTDIVLRYEVSVGNRSSAVLTDVELAE